MDWMQYAQEVGSKVLDSKLSPNATQTTTGGQTTQDGQPVGGGIMGMSTTTVVMLGVGTLVVMGLLVFAMRD